MMGSKLFEGFVLLRKEENNIYFAVYLNELAKLYTEIRDYDKALEYCNRAIQVNNAIDNQLGIGINYQTLGEVYARKDKIENAEKYLNKGLEIIEQSEDLPVRQMLSTVKSAYS